MAESGLRQNRQEYGYKVLTRDLAINYFDGTLDNKSTMPYLCAWISSSRRGSWFSAGGIPETLLRVTDIEVLNEICRYLLEYLPTKMADVLRGCWRYQKIFLSAHDPVLA